MEPVAVPALAAADAGSESDPLAPHADRTTQHATMDAPRPRDRDIWKPVRKAGMTAFRQTPRPATMSRDGDYVFVSMRLTRSNITSIRAISSAPIGERIIGIRHPNRDMRQRSQIG